MMDEGFASGYRYGYSHRWGSSLYQRHEDYPGVTIKDIQNLDQLTFELGIKYDCIISHDKKFQKFDEYYADPILIECIKGFNWYLEIIPNGYGWDDDPFKPRSEYKQYFKMYLCLESLPKNLKWVKANWEVRVKEIDKTFRRQRISYWSDAPSLSQFNQQSNQMMDEGWINGHGYYVWDSSDINNHINYGGITVEDIKDLDQLTFELGIRYDSLISHDNKFQKFDEYYADPILN
eukprot:CAMPEP_0201594960 /NCGR_PEP_ID=MMETSP0190_2-20130828/192112_1 /ASSEMBLY_ACC=CAM_ASM_000263 /TAXON_ID=37353 /ORGANISM="Rosalina sp." /LENGTH=233 /DNA_ID=CAMNT_0048054767 /DNA_START=851 /DNA_END=1553 /DNA_ORIENTATION=-